MTGTTPALTKRDKIVEELRSLIATGEIPRGARLQQDELAERFDTSITPVREALRLLEAEGLLVGEPHRGVRVAAPDRQRVKATYIMRRLVEPYAMQRAARRMSRLDLDTADALNAAMTDAQQRGDQQGVRESNRDFHFLFYDRCGIPELANEIRGLWRVFPWDVLLVVSSKTVQSVEEHRAMIAAVRAGDLAEVARATEAHLQHGYLALVERLGSEPGPDPFDLDVN